MVDLEGLASRGLSRRGLLGGGVGLLALGVLPGLVACGTDTAARVVIGGAGGGIRPIAATALRREVGVADVPNLGDVVDGVRAFGTNLHGVSATAGQNWTASPLSIGIAFGMLRAGARGVTGQQLDTAFGFPQTSAPEGSPHAAFNALTADLVTTGPVPRAATTPTPTASADGAAPPPPLPVVAIANGLFLDRRLGAGVRPEYLALVAREYGAQAQTLDLSDPGAVQVLNAWAAAQTSGRIKEVFDHLDADTELVLMNAVYLKAGWAEPFTEALTRQAAFSTATGGTVQAKQMTQHLRGVPYAETDAWQRVALPYAGGELTMRIVLPRTVVRDVAALTALLPAAMAPRGIGDPAVVTVHVPQWDTATKLDLKAMMPALGVSDAFDPARADLSGIDHGLFVGQAVHRANITVDEAGTEAAAVTALGAVATSAEISTAEITVDRPFVWAIVHEPTGTPVFAGHVVDPTA